MVTQFTSASILIVNSIKEVKKSITKQISNSSLTKKIFDNVIKKWKNKLI